MWTIMSSASFVVLQAFQWLIVSHFIAQEGLGILSIANVFCFLAISLLETGVVLSIIQAGQINDSDIGRIWTFNMQFALILSIILVCISFGLEVIYRSEGIKKVVWYMIPVVLMASSNTVFIAKLKRAMLFKKISIYETVTFILSFCVVLYFAVNGHEYLSIVYGFWVRHFFLLLLLWVSGSMWLNKEVKPTHIKQLQSFGKYIYGEKILTAVISNADALLVGKLIGLDDLGVYDIFKKIILRPILVFYDGVEKVAFSALSKLKSESKAYNTTYVQFIELVSWIAFPLIGVIYVNSNLILEFLPESYDQYEMTLKYFCLLIGAIITCNPLDLILYSNGASKSFLKWMCIYSSFLLILIYFTAKISLGRLILGLSVFYVFLFLIAFFAIVKPNTHLKSSSYFGLSLGLFIGCGVSAVLIDFLVKHYQLGNFLTLSISFLLLIIIFVIRFRKRTVQL